MIIRQRDTFTVVEIPRPSGGGGHVRDMNVAEMSIRADNFAYCYGTDAINARIGKFFEAAFVEKNGKPYGILLRKKSSGTTIRETVTNEKPNYAVRLVEYCYSEADTSKTQCETETNHEGVIFVFPEEWRVKKVTQSTAE